MSKLGCSHIHKALKCHKITYKYSYIIFISLSFPGVITLQIENVTRLNNCSGKTMKAKAFND